VGQSLHPNKCYQVINVSEQHSKDFSRWSDISDNANAGGTVVFKSYNLKST